MTTFLIATRNQHKVQEIQAVLSERFRFLTLKDYPQAPAVLEDTDTFAGNAAKKANGLAAWMANRPVPTSAPEANPAEPPLNGAADRVFVLADDSGLEVDALHGAPGVHSARFAALDRHQAGNSSDADNNAKLLRLLQTVPAEQRTARFRCVIALAPVPSSPAAPTRLFEGVCEGRVGFSPRGGGGFGYDPLFVPSGYPQTFAELGESVKNRLSHRAQALTQLKAWLSGAAEDGAFSLNP